MRYDVAQICLNGHLITGSYPSQNQAPFCEKCGEPTIAECQNCNTAIRGDYHGTWTIGASVRPFCYNCGKPFPWTERRIDAAKKLAAEVEGATADEILKAQESFALITSDTPETGLAAARIARVLKKSGPAVGAALVDILKSVATDAAKKLLGL